MSTLNDVIQRFYSKQRLSYAHVLIPIPMRLFSFLFYSIPIPWLIVRIPKGIANEQHQQNSINVLSFTNLHALACFLRMRICDPFVWQPIYLVYYNWWDIRLILTWGYHGGSPTAVQAWQPCPLWELSPSHPILCRLRDLLCFVFIVSLLYFSVYCVIYVCLQYFDTVGWVLRPVKTVSRITYTVLVETLNPAQSINQSDINLSHTTWTCYDWAQK